MRFSLKEAARITGASASGEDALLLRAVTDSRLCQPGDLFVCIKGANVDGHDFAGQALQNGAGAILAEHPLPDIQAPLLVAQDSIQALGRLASAWRGRYQGQVIALTGTAGKTTLKDTLAAILAQAGTVNFTEKNHNNQLGVALSILNATGQEDFWLLEAGISHEHDMDELGAMLEPDLAIILNAAEGHTEGLGAKGVAWHKARLLRWLRKGGSALVNADYPDLAAEAQKYPVNINFFGSSARHGQYASLLSENSPGAYNLLWNDEKYTFVTPFNGGWGAEITLAAAAAAGLLGLKPEHAQKGFAETRMPSGRLTEHGKDGFSIFDDTYNANPLSMGRMLESVADKAKRQNRPWVGVLGEMGELGSLAASCHRELGLLLRKLAPRLVIWKGGHGNDVLLGACEAGMPPFPFFQINSEGEFAELIDKLVASGQLERDSCVLFKGSRFNHMEEFLKIFQERNFA